MSGISLCMIVKNEEDTLVRCLESVYSAVDEIIIVDTGSSDGTKRVASWYTDKIFDFVWCDDFSAARNYSFSKASCEYIMWLDADDIITAEDAVKLTSYKDTLDTEKPNAVMCKYNTGFDSDDNVTFSYYRERILRRECNFVWCGAVHEAIALYGKIFYSDISVTHKSNKTEYSDRNLKIYEGLIKNGIAFSPRDEYYYSRELWYNGEYEKAISGFEHFLKREDGWIENKIDACLCEEKCLLAAHKEEDAFNALFKSFLFDLPRAEICCEIGRLFFENAKYSQSAYWYERAICSNQNDKNGSFTQNDCHDFLPYLHLCVCYDRMGDIEKAKEYNARAAKIKPNDKSVEYNQKYFSSL